MIYVCNIIHNIITWCGQFTVNLRCNTMRVVDFNTRKQHHVCWMCQVFQEQWAEFLSKKIRKIYQMLIWEHNKKICHYIKNYEIKIITICCQCSHAWSTLPIAHPIRNETDPPVLWWLLMCDDCHFVWFLLNAIVHPYAHYMTSPKCWFSWLTGPLKHLLIPFGFQSSVQECIAFLVFRVQTI